MDLRLVDLQAGYGNLDILHGVDLSVSAGEFVSLMGPNGAGKSTLLKTIYGMTTIKSGSILWGGTELAGMKPRDVLGQGISYVPQGRCNFPQMTVEENLEMAAYTIPGGEAAFVVARPTFVLRTYTVSLRLEPWVVLAGVLLATVGAWAGAVLAAHRAVRARLAALVVT